MRVLKAIWRVLRQFSVHACYHAVYASFYILAIQTARFIKNRRRRFKKKLPLFFKRLFHIFIRPLCMIFGFFTAPRGKRLRCFFGGCARLVAVGCVLLFIGGTVRIYLYYRAAYRVEYCGVTVGYVSSDEMLQKSVKYVGQVMQFADMEELPTLFYTLASPSQVMSPEEVGEAIVSCHGDTMSRATGLFVDGTCVGVTTTRNELEKIVESIRTSQDDGTECKPSAFKQKVELVDGAYPKDMVSDADAIKAVLLSEKKEPIYYTVKEGDTLTGIARANGITLSKLRERNAKYRDTDVLHAGDRLVIREGSALLQVCRYKEATYTEDIPFETKVYFNDKFYENEERIFVKGENGSRRVTAVIEYTDGVESGRTELSSETLTKPVTQKMRIGTIKGDRPNGAGVSTGKLIWPLPHFNTITSYFGPRWGTVHQGLDISGYNVYGASIVAADGGRVYAVNRTSTWGTGMFAGYGYAVIIDHGNGMRTLYAHCSRIAVTAGQKVTKGQVIAYVGNTGKSTGAHLHFEVRINNKRVNPLNYLKR